VKDYIEYDIYQLEVMIKCNSLKRKDDLFLLEQLNERGYIEENGYAWSYPRAAEFHEMCRIFLEV